MLPGEDPKMEPGRLVIQPNASLDLRGALAFMALMCTVSFTLAGGLAVLGYWMVLPFSGLEMAALGAALWWSMRDNVYREIVTVEAEQVRVETGRGRPETTWEFQRAWVQVRLQPGRGPTSVSRLWLGSHGRGCVIGSCLTEEERDEVAARLRYLVRRPMPMQ